MASITIIRLSSRTSSSGVGSVHSTCPLDLSLCVAAGFRAIAYDLICVTVFILKLYYHGETSDGVCAFATTVVVVRRGELLWCVRGGDSGARAFAGLVRGPGRRFISPPRPPPHRGIKDEFSGRKFLKTKVLGRSHSIFFFATTNVRAGFFAELFFYHYTIIIQHRRRSPRRPVFHIIII